MPKPEGQLVDTVGPLGVLGGMDAGTPTAQLPPDTPEQLLNVDLENEGRAIPRPGSIFHARIGEGAILGIFEHDFEFGLEPRRPVAVVADAYATVNTRVDSTFDGVVTHNVAFCRDWSTHGVALWPITARQTDRFHFQSFLNRLYIAGSTVDHALLEYDFVGDNLIPIEGVKGTAVVASGNRLFVGGDPVDPNRLFPSDPDDPTTFQPQLAFQIGTRNDRILSLLEDDGLIFVGTERSVHWVVAGAVEIGELQTDDVTTKLGVAAPLAAAVCADGHFYWIDPTEGPVRWRRGQAAPDLGFAKRIVRNFQAARGTDKSGWIVEDDTDRGKVRFLISTGSGQTPDYLMTYDYRQDAWSHGASTRTSWPATRAREQQELQSGDLGDPLYTDLVMRRDPLDGFDKLYGGDQLGHVWTWNLYSPDKRRSGLANEEGTLFSCLLRFGPLEIAPVKYRAMIQEAILDFVGSYEFSFDLFAEVDYEDQFNFCGTCRRDIPGANFGDLQLDTTIYSARLHPMHLRFPIWSLSLGKIVRLEIVWDATVVCGFTGIEFERSLEPPSAVKIQSPPKPFGELVWNGLLDPPGNDGPGDTENGALPPHPEPPPTGDDPDPLLYMFGGAGGDLTVNDRRHQAMNIGSPEAGVIGPVPPDYANSPQRANMAFVRRDEVWMWTVFYESSYWLNQIDISTGVHTLEREDDLDAFQLGDGQSSLMGCYGGFYDAANGRLFLTFWGFGGSWSGSQTILLCLDITPDDTAPTQVARIQSSTPGLAGYPLMRKDLSGGVMMSGNHTMHSFSFSGAAFAYLDTLIGAGWGSGFPSGPLRIIQNYNGERNIVVVVGHDNGVAGNDGFISTVDVSDLSNLLELDTLTLADVRRPGSVVINKAGTTAYVWNQHRGTGGTDASIQIFDITDLANISLTATIEPAFSLSSGFAPHGNLLALDPAAEAYLFVMDPERMFTVRLSDNVVFGPWNYGQFGSMTASGAAWQNEAGPSLPEDGLPGAAGLEALAIAKGVLGIISLSTDQIDYSSPEIASAFLQAGHGLNPSAIFNEDGEYVLWTSSGSKTLTVLAFDGDARSMRKVTDLVDSRFAGARGLTRKSTSVHIVNGSKDVAVVDISDPEVPVVASVVPANTPGRGGAGYPPTLVGRLLDSLVITGYGVEILDDAGGWLGSTSDPRISAVKELLHTGTKLIGVSDDGGLRMFRTDVTNQVAVESALELAQSYPGALEWGADVAYYLGSVNGVGTVPPLVIVDTAAALAVLGTFGDSRLAQMLDMVLVGTDLWCVGANANNNILLLDASTPGAVTIDEFTTGLDYVAVTQIGGNLFAIDGNGVLESWSVGPLTMLDSLALTVGGAPQRMESVVIGAVDYVVIVTKGPDAELIMVNVDVPAVLAETGRTPTGASGIFGSFQSFSVDVASELVVTTTRSNLVGESAVIDISTPATPVVLGRVSAALPNHFEAPYSVAVAGTDVFFGCDNGRGGIDKFDLTVPAVPALTTEMAPSFAGWRDPLSLVAVSGDVQTVLAWRVNPEWASWVNISNLFAPRVLSKVAVAGGDGSASAIAINQDGTRAYVARGIGGSQTVSVFDVGAPGTATLLGSWTVPTGNAIKALAVSGPDERVIAFDPIAPGVQWTIDFSTPGAPVVEGELSPMSSDSTEPSDIELY